MRAASPQEWRRTVDRMLAKSPGTASATPASRAAIAETLIRRRSVDERWILRLRCGKCHSVSVIDGYHGLSDRALKMLVNRHVAENNESIFAWEGNLAFDQIRRRFLRPPEPYSPPSEGGQVAFESRCDVCHTITFRYRTMFQPRRDDDQWSRVVERMRAKAPDYISENDVPALVAYIRRMRDAMSVTPD